MKSASHRGQHKSRRRAILVFLLPLQLLLLLAAPRLATAAAQPPDPSAVVGRIDAAVARRVAHVLGFTDVEHYAVYRGRDQTHPIAEMTVRDTYKEGVGKQYTILSERGSSLVLRFGLLPLLTKETAINQPGQVQNSWFTTANYAMKLVPGGVVESNGRPCNVLRIQPWRKAPNRIAGTLWADARDGTLVQIDGVASERPSVFAGVTHMMRQYTNIDGFAMATHARAETHSLFAGRIVVRVDYSDYHLQLSAKP